MISTTQLVTRHSCHGDVDHFECATWKAWTCMFQVIHLLDERISLKSANGIWLVSLRGRLGVRWLPIWYNPRQRQSNLSSLVDLSGGCLSPSAYIPRGTFPYASPECLFIVFEPIISKEIPSASVIYNLSKGRPTSTWARWWEGESLPSSRSLQPFTSCPADALVFIPAFQSRHLDPKTTWPSSRSVRRHRSQQGSRSYSSVDFTLSVTFSYSHEWGGLRNYGGVHFLIYTPITVLAGKKGRATVLVKRERDGHSPARRSWYKDGKTKINETNRVYNNIEFLHCRCSGWKLGKECLKGVGTWTCMNCQYKNITLSAVHTVLVSSMHLSVPSTFSEHWTLGCTPW